MYHQHQWNPLVYNCANLNSLDVEDDAVWPGLKGVAGFDQPPTDIIFDHCSDDESDLSLTGSSSAGTSQSSSSIYCDDDVENTLKEVSLLRNLETTAIVKERIFFKFHLIALWKISLSS